MLLVLGSVQGTTLNEAGLKDPVVARVAGRFNRLPALQPDFIAHRVTEGLISGRQRVVLPAVAAPAVHLRQMPGRLSNLLMKGVD